MNALIAAIVAAAFVFIQCYISGTRLAYSLPAYLMLAIAGILTLFAKVEARRQISRWCLAATALCFGYLLYRCWHSPVEYLSRADFFSMLGCLTVYGLTVGFITDRRMRVGIICVLLALAVVEAMLGAYQYAGRPDWLPFNLEHIPSILRGRGSFISSIHFAGFLEAIAPFALAIAFWGSRTPWMRWMAGSIGVLCYFAIALSGSRGAWISSVFSLVIFAILCVNATRRAKRERFGAVIYLTILAVVLLPTVIVGLMKQSEGVRTRLELLGKMGEVQINEYDIRIYNWQAALDQWRQSPLIGTGAGTHLYYGRLYRRPQLQPDPVHAHSDYLELLAEYGIIGGVAVGIFLLTHLAAGLRAYNVLLERRRDDPYRPLPELALSIGALTAFSAYFAHSAVDFNLHLPGNALFIAFIFGLLANAGIPPADRDEEVAYRHPHWLAKLALPALAACLAVLAIRHFPSEYWATKARIALREKKYDEAIAHSHKALESEKRNPFIYFNLGQAHRLKEYGRRVPDRNELRAAEKAFLSGLEIFPQDEVLWVRLAQTLDALGEFPRARAAYEKAIALDPQLGILYGFYARHLKLVGRPDDAEAAYQKGQALTAKDLAPFIKDPAETFDDEGDRTP